jgi:polysaccharide deacetylase family protein (PEP-CTERM system associated)
MEMKILTFDVEDWFHVLDNLDTQTPDLWNKFPSRAEQGLERILECLSQQNQKATFFILGWMAEKYPSLIKKIDSCGHHIASHSYGHQLVYQQSRNAFREDLYRSKMVLEELISKPITAYRAPGFSVTNDTRWVFDELIDLQFKIDCSIFPAIRSHGGMPEFTSSSPCISYEFDAPLKFFPINSRCFAGINFIYSGGGYFRLFPEWLLKRWFAKDPYVMTYFHPRDFDPDQPIIPGLNSFRKFKCYVGLAKALKKLEAIVSQNNFISLDTADIQYDWSTATEVKVRQYSGSCSYQ